MGQRATAILEQWSYGVIPDLEDGHVEIALFGEIDNKQSIRHCSIIAHDAISDVFLTDIGEHYWLGKPDPNFVSIVPEPKLALVRTIGQLKNLR